MTNQTQYHITYRGRKALAAGDHLIHLASEAARDGIVSTKEIVQLQTGLTETDAGHIISILSRLGLIEPAPIQGIQYTER